MVRGTPPDINKLRGNRMVRKIGTSRRYEPIPQSLRAMIGPSLRTNRTISLSITYTSGLACGALLPYWGWLHIRIDNLFFVFSNKRLAGRGLPRCGLVTDLRVRIHQQPGYRAQGAQGRGGQERGGPAEIVRDPGSK